MMMKMKRNATRLLSLLLTAVFLLTAAPLSVWAAPAGRPAAVAAVEEAYQQAVRHPYGREKREGIVSAYQAGLAALEKALTDSELAAAKDEAVAAIEDAAAVTYRLPGEAAGTVWAGVTDNGVRDEEDDNNYPDPLGEIVPLVQVPYCEGENIAAVTLRMLEAYGIDCYYTGNAASGFYLSALKDFYLADGTYIDSFGEYDGGFMSGWMVTCNNWFLDRGASDFQVEADDVVRWQFTCMYGSDIGNDWFNPSAKITGVRVVSSGAALAPSFSDTVKEYTLRVDGETDTVRLEALQENYGATLTYRVGNKTYKLLQEIPVIDGTEIVIECTYPGGSPDADRVTLTVTKEPSAAERLEQAKRAAVIELENYTDPAGYRPAQRDEREQALAAGKAAIEAAGSFEAVEAALTAAKEALDTIPTDGELSAGELNEARKTAAEELTGYKDPADYRPAQQRELEQAVADGLVAIAAAGTAEEVGQALAAAKAVLDGVKTNAQLTDEERQTLSDRLETAIRGVIQGRKINDQLTGDSVLGSREFTDPATGASSTWSDWLAMAMGRYSFVRSDGSINFCYDDGSGYQNYREALERFVTAAYEENGGSLSKVKATEWHRLILTVAALGGDPTRFGTYEGRPIDLVADGTYNCVVNGGPARQGINGVIYALLAKNAVIDGQPEQALYTDEYLIGCLLENQLADGPEGAYGGWALRGNESDPDITAMAVQALAPYYHSEKTYSCQNKATGQIVAKTAARMIDEALAVLSSRQLPGGDYASWGTENAESTAQVLIALCELGIDPAADSRFITAEGKTLLDGLMKYRLADGSFTHAFATDAQNPEAAPGAYNQMATDQAGCALVAYWRYVGGRNSLYNMRSDEAAADRTAAQKVSALIDAIGEVNLDSEEAIRTARQAYNTLTAEQKVLVDNYAVLEAAEEALAALKAAGSTDSTTDGTGGDRSETTRPDGEKGPDGSPATGETGVCSLFIFAAALFTMGGTLLAAQKRQKSR